MSDRHNPRNWHWHEGIPESLKPGSGKDMVISSTVPDRRDTSNAEELGNAILARRFEKMMEEQRRNGSPPPHTPVELTDDAV